MAANESLDAIIAALGAILMAAPQGDRQRAGPSHRGLRSPLPHRLP
jgi:hypothetical protein